MQNMKKFLTLILLATLFVGCSSDDDENNNIDLKTSDVILSFGDESQIGATSDSKITYSSEDEYYASVSDAGLIKAGRVGETRMVLTNGKDTKSLKVTVKATSNLYPEPNIEFGISRSDLIKKLGTPDRETSTGIGYDNYSTNAPQVAYIFDTNNKLTSSSVLVKSSQSSNLGTFLGERYIAIGSEGYTIFFINSLLTQNPTMGVGANLYNVNYWMVLYMSYNGTKQKSTFDSEYLVKGELEKLFK